MSGALIAQLLIQFGPPAFQLIESLAQIWTKQLTVEEVLAFTGKAKLSYDDYINQAKAALPVTPPAPTLLNV